MCSNKNYLKFLAARSTMYFEDREANEFIETASYKKAAEILDKNKIVVLSGHPGEGKTTVAKQLLLARFPARKCINLAEPADWKCIDFSLNLIDAILIDDIFGAGVLDERLLNKWERKMDDLTRVIKEKGISVVITSRHYILEESKQIVRTFPLFRKEHIQILSSKDLTEGEKIKILESHLKAKDRNADKEQVLKCVWRHSLVFERILFGTNEFMFGFPESVHLFTKQDDLFERGDEFFANPNSFFKRCIQQLYREEEKFLALIVIWANAGQHLKKSDLDESQLSHRVQKIAKRFHFKLKGKLIKRLRKSLDYHINGLLHFAKENGTYTFSHNIICDMVGLVIAEENKDEVLEFCTREFLLTYATTLSVDDDFKFCVDEYLYEDLAKKFVDIMLEDMSIVGLLVCGSSILQLHRGGKMKNTVVPNFGLDFSIIKHDSFRNKTFVDTFLDYLTDEGHLEKLLAQEIMAMSGFFLRYGIKIYQQKYFLLSYAVYIKADIFAERIIMRKLLDKTTLSNEEKDMEYILALCFGVHHKLFNIVKVLVQHNAILTEASLYIAAHQRDVNILKFLLGHKDRKKLKHIEIANGNNALIVASKKDFGDVVKCFIESGYDLTARNNDGMSALDKAVAYKNEDICEMLAKSGAPLNIKSPRFKRTPLHTAADIGLLKATEVFLLKGAQVKVKDHKGFFPIHSAALNGHLDVVRKLLEHDPTQARILTKTYGKMSALKGKTIFHIALHMKDYTLLEALLKTNGDPNVTDLYGRTPFLEAVSSGNNTAIEMLKDVTDLNMPDQNGFSPLHIAVYRGYLKVVKLLCSYPSVNVNAKDKYGKTPLHITAIKGFPETFLELIDHGADWRMVTKRGDTILHLLARNKRLRPIQAQIASMVNDILVSRYGYREHEILSSEENCPPKFEDYNTINAILCDIDPDFVQLGLKNKRGYLVISHPNELYETRIATQ